MTQSYSIFFDFLYFQQNFFSINRLNSQILMLFRAFYAKP